MINSKYLRMATALRLARPLIEYRVEEFLCHALDYVGRRHPTLKNASAEAQRWVRGMIAPYFTYNSWVHILTDGVGLTEDEARLGRLAWIDWMISELEKE